MTPQRGHSLNDELAVKLHFGHLGDVLMLSSRVGRPQIDFFYRISAFAAKGLVRDSGVFKIGKLIGLQHPLKKIIIEISELIILAIGILRA